MKTMIINVKDKKDFELLTIFLKGLEIKARILSDEEKEDFGLIELMKEVDRDKTMSRDSIFSKLSS
jgi:hypothetical protein